MTSTTVTDEQEPQRAAAVKVRPAAPSDAPECARIIFEAFASIHDHHRFARDVRTLEAASQLAGASLVHPSICGVVAELDGRVVGSNFLDERGPIRGVGPVTVEPGLHEHGIGRKLMQAVLERSTGARGVRLLQDSFNSLSLTLYASLGFEVREPTVILSGRPRSDPGTSVKVRPLTENDIEESEQLCLAVHGYERTAELRDAL
jgi:predicted N-acetyltransferase YhbS